MKTVLHPTRLLALLLLASVASAHAASRSSANYTVAADIVDQGGRRATSAAYSNDGSAGSAGGASSAPSGPITLTSGYPAQLELGNILSEIVSVVSRKVHGAGGPFDIPLPLNGLAGIEPRVSAMPGSHQVIVTFASPVTAEGVSVMSSDGQAGATRSVNGGVITLDLSAVANAQTIGITLFNVSNGSTAGDIFVPMGVLVGDTNGNGAVTATDVAQAKSQSGQAATSANFRTDVNASGSVNATDIGLVKSRSGTLLP